MTLRTDKGATLPVTATRTYTGVKDTYNLTVADLHTYYVLAGTIPVLVHNTCLDWTAIVDKKGHDRVTHVRRHEVDAPNRENHGVFWDEKTGTAGDSYALINEAWSIKQKINLQPVPGGGQNGAEMFRVPMGRIVGYESGKSANGVGQPYTHIEILVRNGNHLTTGYPK